MSPARRAAAGGGRALPAVRRLVVKVGSSSLTDGRGRLDETQIAALARQIAAVRRTGVQPILVSSGAIAAGIGPLGLPRRPADVPTQQAAASVGQGILMHAYQREFGRRRVRVGQVLLTQNDFVQRRSYLNGRHTLDRLLEMGVVPVVNENDAVAVEEIRFSDNDRIAALVANMIHADLLLILSDIDGLYDGDPSKPGARLIDVVPDLDALKGLRTVKRRSTVGSGGMASKIEAVRIAAASGVGVVVANARRDHVVRDVLAGKAVGTYFPPHRGRGASRKLWIAYAQMSRGRIVVDAGARDALVKGGKSLLAAGVAGCSGSFAAGDAVEVAGPDGVVFAKGIVAYGHEEIPQIQGRRTDRGREVIHRDSLVIL